MSEVTLSVCVRLGAPIRKSANSSPVKLPVRTNAKLPKLSDGAKLSGVKAARVAKVDAHANGVPAVLPGEIVDVLEDARSLAGVQTAAY